MPRTKRKAVRPTAEQVEAVRAAVSGEGAHKSGSRDGCLGCSMAHLTDPAFEAIIAAWERVRGGKKRA